MGVIELASGNSVWRGMDYYKSVKAGGVKVLHPDFMRVCGVPESAEIS